MTRLSQNDATLAACLNDISAVHATVRFDNHTIRERDDLYCRWADLSNRMIATPADTMDGVIAKALALSLEIEDTDPDGPQMIGIDIVKSLVSDLMRVASADRTSPRPSRGVVVPLRPAPNGGDAA